MLRRARDRAGERKTVRDVLELAEREAHQLVAHWHRRHRLNLDFDDVVADKVILIFLFDDLLLYTTWRT